MAKGPARQSLLMDAFTFGELVFHTTVREIRHDNPRNPVIGLLMAVSRTLAMVGVFYVIYEALGARQSTIPGDTMLYLVSGFLLFFLHTSAIGTTISAGNSQGPLQQHAPVTPALMIAAEGLKTLYLYTFTLGIILLGLYVFKGSVYIYDWPGMILPFLLAWSSGIVIGLLFLAIKPYAPGLTRMVSTIFMRANFITSGKFFVANTLPGFILPFFTWNPLFHTIDQMRGAMFLNYVPRNTSMSYAIYFVAIGVVIGLMFEFHTRRTISRSSAYNR